MKWETYCLGDLYEVHNGLAKGREFFGQGYPFLSFSTVFNNYFLPEQIVELVQSTDKEQENYSILRGDVFVTRTSETSDELGISCVALKDYPFATYNGFCKRMRPITEVVLPEFIGYYMRMPSFRNEFLAFSTMTTRASLRNEDLLGIKITIPSLDNQKKIANILLSYDKLIRNNQKQIKLLEESAQRLYKEWFVDLRFPGYEDVEIVDGVPKGWKRTAIGKYVSIRSGYAFKSEWWQETGYPVIKIKDITNNTIEISELGYVEPDKTKKALEFKLNKNDIVIAMTGATIGKIGLVPEVDDLYTNQRVGKFFPKECIVNKTGFFFCYYIQSKVLEEILAVSSSSSAQPNISGKQLEAFEVVANEEIINKFNDLVEPYLDKINVLRKQVFILKEARDRLLPKLMSGEVEV